MLRILCLICLAAPALADEAPGFIDDRSSPERVVISLYNAIDRQEYLRGWSYFSPDAAPPYPQFRDGYAETASVVLRLGKVESEGAAGSVYSSVPVALRAVGADGAEQVFIGCYRLRQVQPAIQDRPPFRPITIESGKLLRSDKPFAEAMGVCTD
ncbi:MAG: hypothetical protein Q4G26_13010 [Paracoccus sp. (in: a-proteobacteria)]|nr:hypothetical protein [Paracoccus sp. (in: a-proteobacteria)]